MTESSKTQGRRIYKIYVQSLHRDTDEELNAVLGEGWEIDKFSTAVNDGGDIKIVFLLRRWQDGGAE